RGVRTNREPFVIDNDSFPTLINAFQWRGRVKRKRGTTLLTRLERFFVSNSTSYSNTATIVLNGSGTGNILTDFGLQANGNIVPGTVLINQFGTGNNWTDPAKDGTLSPSGTINYATGIITIPALAGATIQLRFNYYPD